MIDTQYTINFVPEASLPHLLHYSMSMQEQDILCEMVEERL